MSASSATARAPRTSLVSPLGRHRYLLGARLPGRALRAAHRSLRRARQRGRRRRLLAGGRDRCRGPEPLSVLAGGRGVEDLARLKMDVWQLAVQLLYLLPGERLEDVHQREEPYPLFRSQHNLSLSLSPNAASTLPPCSRSSGNTVLHPL